MFIPTRVTSTLGVPSPPSTENIIRYMLGQPLDFDPGSKYVYSASAIDYAKFLNAIDGRRGPRLLSAASVATLTQRPNLAEYQGTGCWYAMGMEVNTSNNW